MADQIVEILTLLKETPWLAILIAIVVIVIGFFATSLLRDRNVGNLLYQYVFSSNPFKRKKRKSKDIDGFERIENVASEASQSPEKADVNVVQTFSQRMKSKSSKVVHEAEKGEMKVVVDRCKKFLSTIQASNFASKVFINSWEDIEGLESFHEIVENIGSQLKLPKDDIEGIKLAASGSSSKRDYLSFECAMKDEGQVRLHIGGYHMRKQKTDTGEILVDFEIALNYTDISDITFKNFPEPEVEKLEQRWFNRGQALVVEDKSPDTGEDWNAYFTYMAHKNLLQEMQDD